MKNVHAHRIPTQKPKEHECDKPKPVDHHEPKVILVTFGRLSESFDFASNTCKTGLLGHYRFRGYFVIIRSRQFGFDTLNVLCTFCLP